MRNAAYRGRPRNNFTTPTAVSFFNTDFVRLTAARIGGTRGIVFFSCCPSVRPYISDVFAISVTDK